MSSARFGRSTLWLLALLVAGFCTGCTAEGRHRRVVRRISEPIQQALQNLPSPSFTQPDKPVDDVTARVMIMQAINTALYNEFWYARRVSAPKFLAVAERLEQTGAKDLETVQGCLKLMDLLEEACPTAREYSWFATIHEAQAEGNFPKLKK